MEEKQKLITKKASVLSLHKYSVINALKSILKGFGGWTCPPSGFLC
jgi:hypothetical protein